MSRTRQQHLRAGVLLSLCAFGLAGATAQAADAAQDEAVLQSGQSTAEVKQTQEEEWEAQLLAQGRAGIYTPQMMSAGLTMLRNAAN